MPRKEGRVSTRPAPRDPTTVLIDYFLADFLNDRDRGICSLGCGTIIRHTERCAMAVDAADLRKQVGFICGPCTDEVMGVHDEPLPDTRFCVLCRSREHEPSVHTRQTPDLGEPPY